VARKKRLEKLTISLLKEGLTRKDALRDLGAVAGYRVKALDAKHDSFFAESTQPHPPRWATYLKEHVSPALGELETASASGVLLLEAAARLFAVTFGQGRRLIDPEAFEHDFGLLVVLNTVAPDQLKSVDARTIEETTVHTRRDVSRDSSLSTFGLDVSRDLLRAVTGTPQDPALAHRMTGADALGIWTRAQIPELPALAEQLLKYYEATDYKTHFEFIDHLRPEKNAARIRELNKQLVDDLRTGEITEAHLAAPETLDWLDVGGFTFSCGLKDQEPNTDPRISAYRTSHEDGDIDLAMLKSDKLIALRADGEMLQDWPVYRCIVYQLELDGHLFVLTGAQWFRVDVDYKNKIYKQVNALKKLAGLPKADATGGEKAYNVKAAAELGALCLDRKLIQDSGPDKIELCDILTLQGGLIHVKPRGSSSTLSHLFNQGLNSATRLFVDQEFRSKARALAASEDQAYADVLPADRFDAAKHEISFVIITRSKRNTPLTLPFFSVVSLATAATYLQGYGYTVSIAAVQEETSHSR
jgi:uncharacterized protein (TIGR04141 family)